MENYDMILDDDVLDKLADEKGLNAALDAIDDPQGYISSLTPVEKPEERPHEETPAEFINPFKDQGVPDELMIDDETGKPYENGQILGKYTTPGEAMKGLKESQKIIGRPREGKPEDELPKITPEDPAPTFTPEERRYLKELTYQEVLSQFSSEIESQGFDPRDYRTLEELNALKGQNRALYNEIQTVLDQRFDQQQRSVLEYTQVYSKRESLNETGSTTGFQSWVDELSDLAEVQPDEGDLGALQAIWKQDVQQIIDYDKGIQEKLKTNPSFNPYEDKTIKDWYDRFFEFKAGVPVISSEKLYRQLSERHRDIRKQVLQNVSKSQLASAYDKALAEERGHPTYVSSIGTEQESSLTGSHLPVFTAEDVITGKISWDDILEAHNGDVNKAQAYFDSVMDRSAKRYDGNEY